MTYGWTATEIRAARQVFARHRRRTHTVRCGFCGGVWYPADPLGSGRLVDGCAAVQIAALVLVDAGQLDGRGGPALPPLPRS